jgi:predicted Rossmann fold nucleotide-binding protein DprA/Smf involved in DNA uptake
MTTLSVSADGQAVALACTTLAAAGDRSTKPLSPTDWSGLSASLKVAGMRPRDLLGLDAESIAARLGIGMDPAGRLSALMSRGGQLALELERLESLGIWVISQVDDDYPADLVGRLGRTAPPVLFGSGPRSALNERSIAVVGSRDADDDALAYASRLGALCAGQGFAIASGAARGIDITAMMAAVESGGRAVGITVDPLERLVRRGELRSAIADELLTLATPFHPGARWHQGNAMRRNRLVYAISRAAVVVTTAAGSGGTWAGAIEDLKGSWVPLHVRDDGSQGNRLLISEGGRPLSVDIEDLLVEKLAEPTQDTLLSSAVVEAPRDEPPASAFDAVWPLFVLALDQPRKEKELTERLELQPSQVRAWLELAVDQGLVEVTKRPKRFSLVGHAVDAAQLHLDA